MVRLYSALLKLLPRAFRDRYAVEMVQTFETEAAEPGMRRRARLLFRATRGLIWTAVLVRLWPGEAQVPTPAMRRAGLWAGTTNDLRATARGLRRRPGFTATAVLTIALGVGGVTAVFSVVDVTVVRALPIPERDRVVSFWNTFENQPGGEFLLSRAELHDVRAEMESLELIGGYSGGQVTLEADDRTDARTVPVAFTIGDVYSIVGARPAMGRLPGPEDDHIGAAPVAVLAHGLWQQAFGGDPSVIGGPATKLGAPDVRIVGVLTPDSDLPGMPADVWVHSVLNPAAWAVNRSGHGVVAVGRLRDGATVSSVGRELASLERTWATRYAGQHSIGIDGHAMHVMPLVERALGRARQTGLLLAGAAGLLLLLACANVANLLLARGETRTTEVGVRMALGASRSRVVRLVMLEGFALAVAGGAVGVLLASIGLPALLRLAPQELGDLTAARVDPRVLGVALATSLLTGVLFAVAPALAASRRGAASMLQASGRGRTGVTGGLRVLVAGQMALATVLLSGAGLLARSLNELNVVDPGFASDHRVAVSLYLPLARYPAPPDLLRFFENAQAEVEALPVVEGVTFVRSLPLRDGLRRENILPEGSVDRADAQSVVVQLGGAGVLGTMGIRLLEGRDFGPLDREGSVRVALVNRTAAAALGGSPIGRQVTATFAPVSYGPITIVGVYDDVRNSELASPPGPELMLPLAQAGPLGGWIRNVTLVARTTVEAGPAMTAIRGVIRRLDRQVPVGEVTAIADVVRASTARERFLAVLVAVFAIIALLIAAVGVSGVVAFSVARRGREFAIRHALGARRSGVVFRVVVGHALLAGGGAVGGVVLAAIFAPALRVFLYEVAPRDALVFSSVPLALTIVAVLSAVAPAARASRVPPAQVLQDAD